MTNETLLARILSSFDAYLAGAIDGEGLERNLEITLNALDGAISDELCQALAAISNETWSAVWTLPVDEQRNEIRRLRERLERLMSMHYSST